MFLSVFHFSRFAKPVALLQISTVDLTNAEDCGKKFRSNRNLGFLLWVSIVLSNLLKPNTEEKKDKELSNS